MRQSFETARSRPKPAISHEFEARSTARDKNGLWSCLVRSAVPPGETNMFGGKFETTAGYQVR